MNYNADSPPTHTVHSQHCTDGEEPKAAAHAQVGYSHRGTPLAALRLWAPTKNLLRSVNRLRLFVGWFHNRIPSLIYRVQKQGNRLKLTALNKANISLWLRGKIRSTLWFLNLVKIKENLFIKWVGGPKQIQFTSQRFHTGLPNTCRVGEFWS